MRDMIYMLRKGDGARLCQLLNDYKIVNLGGL